MFLDFLDSGHCALLVVDIQERLMPVIHERERVVKNAALLMKAAAVLGFPLVATTQYREKIGPLLPEIEAELGQVVPMDKMEFSCFNNPAANDALMALRPRVDTLIVCGVESHICVYQTVLGALRAGFHAYVPADAVSSRALANHESGLSRIRDIGGVVGNTEMVIYELLRRAGTGEFKRLLPYLK